MLHCMFEANLPCAPDYHWRANKPYIREFGIRKGLKKLVISSKIRIFIGENQ